jgi:hypothetical protein
LVRQVTVTFATLLAATIPLALANAHVSLCCPLMLADVTL